ncbi:MAG: sensor histidine kinase KdpD [Alphaproteobacteria bacterium]|nr:sensor histidine kinase KdpD [Alphaproteobacteria bacterium]
MDSILDNTKRPSPEALLEKAEEEHRGRLKVFLGAAPGVGKTYEMLEVARVKKQQGIDVVIGIVETHGRRETQSLLQGLEIIPRKQVHYKNRVLEEMDLDAILIRKPALVLVDELAHTNAPTSRHPKRYMDVEEILAAGIDVYTTLNIQHLESLNDVVAQITSIRVRETLPDSVIDRADEIELIDLTSKDLIQRLKEGKVYVADQAQRALKNYFTEGNLTALRELALRRTAQRVDDQMLHYMQAHAISGPWSAGERVLVCVSENPNVVDLVRYARRMADRLQAKWTSIYVETQRYHTLNEQTRDRIAEALNLSEQLGADAVTIPGRNIATDLIDYAKRHNITQIIIGKSERSRWFEILHGSVVHDLVRKAGNIGVHVVAGNSDVLQEKVKNDTAPIHETEYETSIVSAYFYSSLTVLAALSVGLVINNVINIPNISMIFLAAVLFSALRYGLWPSLWASVLSVFSYSYFFLQPLYVLSIAKPSNIVALVFFLIVAILTSNLTVSLRSQVRIARGRANETAELYNFSKKLAAIGSIDDLLWAAAYQIANMLKVKVVLLLSEGDDLLIKVGYPPEDQLDDTDMAAAKWAWHNELAAGNGADTLPGAKRLFLPLKTERGSLGVIGIHKEENSTGPLLSPDGRRLLDAILGQTAIALERIHLVEDSDQARFLTEAGRQLSILLRAVAKDLKSMTQLFTNAITTMEQGKGKDALSNKNLLSLNEIKNKNHQIKWFIENIYDLKKLDENQITVEPLTINFENFVTELYKQIEEILPYHKIDLQSDIDRQEFSFDGILLKKILYNIFFIIAQETPVETKVFIHFFIEQKYIYIEIKDEGPSVLPEELERFRKKFHEPLFRKSSASFGLGLYLCCRFIQILDGTISVMNREDQSGSIFNLKVPISLSQDQSDF